MHAVRLQGTAGVLAVTLALLGINGFAVAQKVSLYDVQEIGSHVSSGAQSNDGPEQEVVFQHELRYPDADWIRLEFSEIVLNDGDFIRIFELERGTKQIITNEDPQYSDPNFAGKIITIIFSGGDVDVELSLAPASQGARLSLTKAWVAYGPFFPTSICGPTDDRVPVPLGDDPCAVRVVDSVGGWASGFMISPNWMVTNHHVMTFGPWTIQRNVPASNAGDGSINPPANANDSFTVMNLAESMTSGGTGQGNDWAVVRVPNNAGGSPGEGCIPRFNCEYTNATAGAMLTVTGFGIDTQNARNGVLQDDTGPSVAGGAANAFRYQVDTTANSSGSRVTDAAGRIVGIHQKGGCNGDGPPDTGSNGGTLITNPGLLAAIKALCGRNICPKKCPEDVNGDGVVNVLDLINLLLCFGLPAGPACQGEDINQDGTINVLDLIQLLLAFGVTCPPNNVLQVTCTDGQPRPDNPDCCDFEWSVSNNGPNPIGQFYLDLEAGTGGVRCREVDLPGWDAVYCYPWDFAVPSNWGIICFTAQPGSELQPGARKGGTMNIEVNQNVDVPVAIPGWLPFTVPGNGIHCHVTSVPPANRGDCPAGLFGPHIDADGDGEADQPWSQGNDWVCKKPPKDECLGAVAIDLAAPPQPQTIKVLNTTVGAGVDVAPACDDQLIGIPVPVVAPGVWYSVIGDGTTLTATTCNLNTIGYDTAISVYCGPCDSLSCVGANADDFLCRIWPDASTVSWCSVPGETYLILVHGATALDVGDFGLEVSSDGILCPNPVPCGPPPNNDNCFDRLPIFDGDTPFDTTGATTDGPAHPECQFDGQTYNDIWFNYTATCTGVLQVSTCNLADYDTDLVVYDGCDCLNLNLLGCNDDTVGCAGFTSQVVVPVLAGNCYKIRVGGFQEGDVGTGILQIFCGG